MENAFPTLGAAVLYLNGFNHGKHSDRLNYLSRQKPDWVMETANRIWERRDDVVGKGEGAQPMAEFCANLLDWYLPDLYTETRNAELDAKYGDEA